MNKEVIQVGYDLLKKHSLFEFCQEKRVFILSHPDIAHAYLPSLLGSCEAAGAVQCEHLLIPPGEQYKTLDMAAHIWTTLLASHHHRDTVLIALGGGMIGDLAGFCASCYLRGVPLIQCPTSLLAQIDAALGGKTAINHPRGKNMIGTFYSPQAVIVDVATLETLPSREYRAGLAEMIKYGIALDSAFFEWLEENLEAVLSRDPNALLQAVNRSVQLKMHIVSKDKYEKGERAVLNFGHTVAHAIESLLDYRTWLHGEAVAVGMVVATHLSVVQGRIQKDLLERLIILLERAGLPTRLPEGITLTAILAKIKQDKKHLHQQCRWVLLKALGKAILTEAVTPLQLAEAIEKTT